MKETVRTLGERLTALGQSVDERFEQVDRRFEQVDVRLEAIERRFDKVDRKFIELREFIAEEGRTTRRHFEVVAERMKEERNLALDQSAAAEGRVLELTRSNATDHAMFGKRLQDHERRLRRLERK